MKSKISEKKLAIGIVCIILGLIILINTPLISTPVKVSEFGILLCMLSVAIIFLGIMFFKKAIAKV